MIDKNLMSPEKRALAEMLEAAAQQVDASPSFKNELEKKLMNAHRPKTGLNMFSVKRLASTAGWTIGWIIIVLIFVWVVRTIAPQPQPAAGNTPFPNVETATPENAFDYTVKEGDTCGMLADKYGITIEELMAVNGLKECTIFIGQVLKIPIKNEASPSPGPAGFDWHGTTLYLNAPLPETPAEMKIYLTRDEVHTTVDDVKALAERFGMSGEIYQMAGDMGATRYLAVDGNQQLSVRSDRYFTYYPDYAGMVLTGVFSTPPNAESLIDEFMQAHGFNFEYKIVGAYLALPLTPDGFTLHHEYFRFSGMMFYFNKDGIAFVDASLLKYDEAATVNIISAQEAFERLLDPIAGNGAGTLMGMSSGGAQEESWRRTFPLDQTITYFGYMGSTGKSITGGAPLVTLDGYTVTGNIEGATENMQNVFVEATGQLHEAGGLKTFEIQSWKIHDGYDEGYQGTIQREGEQIVINTIEGYKLILPDMPSDVPLPLENAYIMGVTQGDTFEWKSFDTRMTQGGGGGGGGGAGGLGFYKLNLTGTPVPLPTPAPQNNLIPQAPFDQPRVDGLRGMLSVTFHKKVDGSQVTEYSLFGNTQSEQYYSSLLTGGTLQGLEKYHGLPIIVWGTVSAENGAINVERYEIPFPDLQFQIAKGRQGLKEIEGQTITVFTLEDGASYVQLMPGGNPDSSIIGIQGDLIQQEILIIPDETFGKMPALRIYSGSIIEEGSPELTISANEPYTYDDSENVAPGDYVQPTLTIEKVELVYYMPDPRSVTSEPVTDQRYLQPAWLFYGHYSDGGEFETLIQALKDEFLLPELAPYTQPG